jgi:hypothetical protein
MAEACAIAPGTPICCDPPQAASNTTAAPVLSTVRAQASTFNPLNTSGS